MVLDEYVAQVQADLIKFQKAYAAHKDEPNWPMVMWYGNWDEQFAFWGEDPKVDQKGITTDTDINLHYDLYDYALVSYDTLIQATAWDA